jgi:four helix bundle protein
LEETKYSLDNFELYKLARQFRRNVYKLIKQLPKEEQYCLEPQMREAIISVTNNIAEGHGRITKKICGFVEFPGARSRKY